MSRPNPAWLAVFLVVLWALMGGVTLLKGGLYIGKHEGDTMHLLEIVERMTAGEWPHLDFMTPIGILAAAPIALFVKLGAGVGHAFIYAQLLVGAVLLPAAWWVGISRLGRHWAYLFGAVVITFATALLHGEMESSVSISMHYNRWAWAATYLALALALLAPRDAGGAGRRRAVPAADGVIVGLALSAMVLIKVTYFVAFGLPVFVAFAMRREWRTLIVAALTGLAVAALVTFAAGIGFWAAYLGDLLTVSQSKLRGQPGDDFNVVVAAPMRLGGSLMLLLSVVLLRQAGRDLSGLVLLLLVPGFFYVTYQNFGNDPQWLMLLGILLFALLPEAGLTNKLGWDMRQAMVLTGVAVFAFAAPSALNLAYSPFRHFAADTTKFSPLLPRGGRHADLQTFTLRASRVDARIAMDGPGSGLEAYAANADRDDPTVLNGETLWNCEVDMGVSAWFDGIARDLEAAGFAGKRILMADILSGIWLYGDFQRPEHGAPWYYGGLPGFDTADYVLVPTCPISPSLRAEILGAIEERGVTLQEAHRSPLYILLRKTAS